MAYIPVRMQSEIATSPMRSVPRKTKSSPMAVVKSIAPYNTRMSRSDRSPSVTVPAIVKSENKTSANSVL